MLLQTFYQLAWKCRGRQDSAWLTKAFGTQTSHAADNAGPLPGQSYTLRKVFTEAEVRAFLTATGDANPLHVDAAAAAARGATISPVLAKLASWAVAHSVGIRSKSPHSRQNGFPRPVLPGILMASLFPAIIGSAFPGVLYATQSLAFRAPALVGDEVEAQVVVSKRSGSRATFTTKCVLVASRQPQQDTGSGAGRQEGLQGEGSGDEGRPANGGDKNLCSGVVLIDGTAMAILPTSSTS